MNKFNRRLLILVSTAAASASILSAQQIPKPLTNADVIKMVKGGLPESVIISSIQSHQGNFNISPDGLIALHKAEVTHPEMDALMAGSAQAPPGPGTHQPPAAHAGPTPTHPPGGPPAP